MGSDPLTAPEAFTDTLESVAASVAARSFSAAYETAQRILRSRGSGGLSFTAGSVSVRAGGAGETEDAARALEAQAEVLMVPWCGEADFAFQGVRG